jgi:IclR family pca regulon transcriptional regulator
VPAYSTAVGHAVLAYLSRDAQIKLLEAVPRKPLTQTTLTNLDALLKRLDQVRRDGFALSDQENVTGLRVLAAPVLDADGVPLAALSVAAPAFAMPLHAFDAVCRTPVMNAAAKLSRAIQAAGAGVGPVKLRQIGR